MTFSAYMPTIKEASIGTKYTLNGNNNENYKMFADAYEDSVTNSACINDIVNLMIGEGLYSYNGLNPKQYINAQDLRLIALDYKIQGQCALQIIWYNGKPAKIYHIPIMNTGLNLDIAMNVTGYWYSYDWNKKYKYVPQFYQKFDGEAPQGDVSMLIIKRPSNEPLFARPNWYSALRWAQNEGALAQHSYKDVGTGFSGQKIINWVGGAGLTLEQKSVLTQNIKDSLSGIDGQRLIVSINSRPENAIIVDNIDPPNVNGTYVNYTEEAEKKILIAHSYPEILLAGSKTGFSSNADEIVVATKSVYRRVINPDREVLLDDLNKIFKTIDPAFDLYFKDFEDVEVEGVDNEIQQTATAMPVLTDETLKAQANLKGSVGGVQSLLEVQNSFSQGITTYESAIAILDLIFGFNREQAIRLLGNPNKELI
jgi:hypothetical protein